MKQIFKINDEFEFVNEWVNTRNGFAHESTLFYNGWEVTTARKHYLNRTWERFEYQSSMLKCLEKAYTDGRIDQSTYKQGREVLGE